ncbi:SprT-like family protein [Thiorhodovibrio winogradskyi]|uniref:SprT-like family protein n=1 Tax=Thiorhodovibrio winogradskyi TaxID=77007 RepID=A0ABZ0S7F4_9GAMM|nr:SprT-like domain-containing protein [Thiorhodovibrio winogradskyi]
MPFTPDEKARLKHLQTVVEQRVRQLLATARQTLGFCAPNPDLRFDLRGQSAGQARFDARGRGLIRFNPWLLLRHGEEFIDQTVPHEIAHWLIFCLYGRNARPHGVEWRQLMTLFGAEPKRCHQYDLDEIPQRRVSSHSYHCACQDHQLSAVRHNRVRKGQTYLCRHCGQALKPGLFGT